MIDYKKTLKVAAPLFIALTGYCHTADAKDKENSLTPMQALGKAIFFDDQLSKPIGQSCASCHSAEFGFTAEDPFVNIGGAVVHGAKQKRAGNRKPPTNAYVTFAENFVVTNGRNGPTPAGGTFWDGRATGETITADIFPSDWSAEKINEMSQLLGPAADQAMGPFLNDVEQNLPSSKKLCKRVKQSHKKLWEDAWGEQLSCNQNVDTDFVHQRIGFAIAAWEASSEVNSFSSKFDMAVAEEIINNGSVELPLDGLTEQENLGHSLFFSSNIGCARFCHASSTASDGTAIGELFTKAQAGYFNIGAPANPENPWYTMDNVKDDNGNILNPLGQAWIDLGVAARDEDGIEGSDFPGHEGKFKAPTLRNVAKRPYPGAPKAFAHNGYFKSLKDIVHFYNTRDLKPACLDANGEAQRFVTNDEALERGCWPIPEVVSSNIFSCDDEAFCKVTIPEGQTVENYCDDENNPRNIGNLCLSSEEEDAIVAFLETLSDTTTVLPPNH